RGATITLVVATVAWAGAEIAVATAAPGGGGALGAGGRGGTPGTPGAGGRGTGGRSDCVISLDLE
ncbi:MAG TPA: hypothetical protein DCQ63_08540, partial [Planktothrix sp. UBA8402]|nr:hypothetical protein [Planktothrix sp. UBA8402]